MTWLEGSSVPPTRIAAVIAATKGVEPLISPEAARLNAAKSSGVGLRCPNLSIKQELWFRV
jgi:hypothetical protein